MLLLRDLLKSKKKEQRVPIWFMRQAGRFLPEYRELRSSYPDFLSFCADPKGASKATLQPLRRFDLDAAIIFSDILVIPKALGQKVEFVKGEGPKLEAITSEADLASLSLHTIHENLQATPEALSLTKQHLGPNQTLVGFSGAPWTLMCYMLEGGGSKNFEKARLTMVRHPNLVTKVLDLLVTSITSYLISQAKAGADVLKLFDSWAGNCPHFLQDKCLKNPVKRIFDNVRLECPDVPLIYFPRGMGTQGVVLTKEVTADAMAIDQFMNPSAILKTTPKTLVLQGGIDPMVVQVGGDLLKREVFKYLNTFKDHPYVFNMGHGMMPEMPIQHISDCIDYVRQWEQNSFSS